MAVSLAFVCVLGVIVWPAIFLFQQGLHYLVAYLGIVLAYAAAFLLLICPPCGTRHVCPGDQTSARLRERIRP